MNEWIEILDKFKAETFEKILYAIPRIFFAVVLILIGWIFALVVEKIAFKIFSLIGIDKISRKSGLNNILKSLAIEKGFSWILAKLVFWIILIVFLLQTAQILGLTLFTHIAATVINIIPNILVAFLIILVGSWVAKVTSSLVRGSIVRIGSDYAELSGSIVNLFVMLITIVIALFQLNIDVQLLSYIILSIIAAFAIGLALAFALGIKEIIKLIVFSAYLHRNINKGERIKIKDLEGTIESSNNIFTTIKKEDGTTISLPNTSLLG